MPDLQLELANTAPTKIDFENERVKMLNRPYTSGVPWGTTLLANTVSPVVAGHKRRRLFGNKIREAVRIIKEGR